LKDQTFNSSPELQSAPGNNFIAVHEVPAVRFCCSSFFRFSRGSAIWIISVSSSCKGWYAATAAVDDTDLTIDDTDLTVDDTDLSIDDTAVDTVG
jgi:hypothetical protein